MSEGEVDVPSWPTLVGNYSVNNDFMSILEDVKLGTSRENTACKLYFLSSLGFSIYLIMLITIRSTTVVLLCQGGAYLLSLASYQ